MTEGPIAKREEHRPAKVDEDDRISKAFDEFIEISKKSAGHIKGWMDDWNSYWKKRQDEEMENHPDQKDEIMMLGPYGNKLKNKILKKFGRE